MAPRPWPAAARAAEGPEGRGAGVGASALPLPALPRPPELKAPAGERRPPRPSPAPVTPPGEGGLGWTAHLPPVRTAAPGRPSQGRLVTPASACPRAGHRLRGPGQEPGDVPRAADPRDHVQVSGRRAAGAGGLGASCVYKGRRVRAPPPRPASGKGSD